MEALIAATIGLLTAVGIYLVLRMRSWPVILGLTFLSYAVNLFIFAGGRIRTGAAPIVYSTDLPADPLPQALVLTAIVISFGMTAVIVMMAIGSFLELGHDRVDAEEGEPDPEGAGQNGAGQQGGQRHG